MFEINDKIEKNYIFSPFYQPVFFSVLIAKKSWGVVSTKWFEDIR